jgi:hypothetical protein
LADDAGAKSRILTKGDLIVVGEFPLHAGMVSRAVAGLSGIGE